MKRIVVLALIAQFLLSFSGNLSMAQQAAQWDWAKKFGGKANDYIHSIVTDPSGNSFICGSFSDSLRFGNLILVSKGYLDVFIAKYDNLGNLVWAQSAGGSDADEAYGIATDGKGGVFITGYFSGKAVFADKQLVSLGDRDMFVAKFNSDGKLIWVNMAGSTAEDYGTAITTDGSGNVYACGIFQNTIQFGDLKIASKGGRDVFVVKYSSEGNVLWAKAGGGDKDDAVTAIAADHAGNCYVTGHFESTMEFDKASVSTVGLKDVFLAKFDGTGNLLWLQKAGSATSDDFSTAIILDQPGNIYISGYFSGVAFFGKTELKSLKGDDFFIAKYSPFGDEIWARQSGGKGDEHGRDLGIDKAGNVYLTGEFNVDFTVGTDELLNRGDWDVFVIKYSSDGKLLRGFLAGGPGNDHATGISLDAASDIFITGYFNKQMTFGNATLSGDAENDGYIAKLKAVQ